MSDHTTVVVDSIPPCDLCGEPAYADAKTSGGPWGYVCERHFREHGCALGLGRGQRLVLRPTVVPRETGEQTHCLHLGHDDDGSGHQRTEACVDPWPTTRDEHEFAEGWDYDPVDHP